MASAVLRGAHALRLQQSWQLAGFVLLAATHSQQCTPICLQARLMSIAANTASDAFDLTYHSGGMGANASKLPERSAAAFVTEVGQRLRS